MGMCYLYNYGACTISYFSRNLLSVNVHSMYSVPDSWQPGAHPYTFTVALPMPISDDVCVVLCCVCGVVCVV